MHKYLFDNSFVLLSVADTDTGVCTFQSFTCLSFHLLMYLGRYISCNNFFFFRSFACFVVSSVAQSDFFSCLLRFEPKFIVRQTVPKDRFFDV